MPDQAPKIDIRPGKRGRLVYDKERRTIVADRPSQMVDGYNLLRDALAWFDAHSVEQKLLHLPQWVRRARQCVSRDTCDSVITPGPDPENPS